MVSCRTSDRGVRRTCVSHFLPCVGQLCTGMETQTGWDSGDNNVLHQINFPHLVLFLYHRIIRVGKRPPRSSSAAFEVQPMSLIFPCPQRQMEGIPQACLTPCQRKAGFVSCSPQHSKQQPCLANRLTPLFTHETFMMNFSCA